MGTTTCSRPVTPRRGRHPPFEPDIRDGRVYARGAADDKGNFLPLLHVACELARAGKLPVNVRVLVEGEEESDGDAASRWLAADERGADCAIVFDAGPADERTPAIIVGLRGAVMAEIEVRTGERDLHSGSYGGSVLNALHVIQAMLSEVVPDPDGWVREELRAGIEPPSEAERRSWERLKAGDRVIAEVGGRPVHPEAGAEYYGRTGADASLDVNEISGGEPRTIVPVTARATLSLRLAPGQSGEEMGAVLEELLRSAIPAGAEVEIRKTTFDPALCDPDSPAVKLAAEALGRACGVEAVLMWEGGSIPIVAELLERGIPTIVSGFSLPDDAIHAPNESYRLESLRLGERSAHELYAATCAAPAMIFDKRGQETMMFKDSKAFSGFAVDDIPAAKEFYGDTLGVEVSDEPAGLGLQLATGGSVFIYPKPNHEPASFTVLNFPVDDIEAAVDALGREGRELRALRRPRPGRARDRQGRSARPADRLVQGSGWQHPLRARGLRPVEAAEGCPLPAGPTSARPCAKARASPRSSSSSISSSSSR